jgi:hypothetical protein
MAGATACQGRPAQGPGRHHGPAAEVVKRSATRSSAIPAAAAIRPDHARPSMLLPGLDSPLARTSPKAMIDGFNRHYRLFRTESARAKHRFETADWHGQQRASASASSSTTCACANARGGWSASSRPPSSRWTCGSRSSCCTSACWSTTASPSWPRPSSTRSRPRSCTAAISRTTSSSCARPSAPSTSRTRTRPRRHLPRLLPAPRHHPRRGPAHGA